MVFWNVFLIVLYIFWITVSSLAIILYKKKKVIKRKVVLILVLVMILLLWSASMYLLPAIGNLFIYFPSPESLFNETRWRTLEAVIYGNDSYMAIYSTREHPVAHSIARRSEDGYQFSGGFLSIRRVVRRFDGQGLFDVYHVRSTNDYYIIWSHVFVESPAVVASELEIRNSDGEEIENMFLRIGYIPIIELTEVWFFMFVDGFTDDFFLYINGERVYLAG